MDKQKWLHERKKIIAGTDIPRLLGIGFDGPLGPYGVYTEKTEEGVTEFEPNEDMLIGLALEDHVKNRFVTEANIDAQSGLYDFEGIDLPIEVYQPSDRIVTHVFDEWIGASLDFIIKGKERIPLECKTSKEAPGVDWGEKGSDIVPQKYLVQLMWQMHALNASTGYIACLFRGWNTCFVWYKIQRDTALIELLVDIAKDFWDRVKSRSGINGWSHLLTEQAVKRASKVVPNKCIVLPNGTEEMVKSYERAADQKRLADKEYERCRTGLPRIMGDNERGLMSDGRVVIRDRDRSAIRITQRKLK